MMRIFKLFLLSPALLFCASPELPDSLTTEASVGANVRTLWNAFSTKEGIESWMVAKTDFELRVGATWRTSYSKDSDLNDDASIHHTILSFDPGRMLSYRTIKPPSGFPFSNELAKTWTVIHLEPLGMGRDTKVTIRMLGFTEDEESQKMRAFFELGNQATLAALIKRYGRGGMRLVP